MTSPNFYRIRFIAFLRFSVKCNFRFVVFEIYLNRCESVQNNVSHKMELKKKSNKQSKSENCMFENEL